jgi:Family of unknown function (DUF695)
LSESAPILSGWRRFSRGGRIHASTREAVVRIPSANIDAWTGAAGERDGLPSLLRFRPNLKNFLGDPRYSRRLQITWTCKRSNTGMPSSEESDSMRAMEDALVEVLEAADAGVLASVFTHGSTRTWKFYVAESADLAGLINDALAELPRLPIDLSIEDDPEWSELRQLLESALE